MFGKVFDGRGNLLLPGKWYWNRKGSLVKEEVTDDVHDK